MTLESLAITNFKNIAETRLDFGAKINCFLGNNGMGKSNLLDAVYYMSFCKSFSGLTDAELIRRGEDFTTVRARYATRTGPEEVALGLQRGRRKSFRRGGKEYDRLSDHIGRYPLVLVSPADQELVNGSGEERRRLMDQVISQTDPAYLDHLIRYTRALQQRNRMLRDHVGDHSLYEALEAGMALSAAYVTRRRQAWAGELSDIFARCYAEIAADGETPAVALSSHLAQQPDALVALFDQNRLRDDLLGHTTAGPHRDDLTLTLNDMPVRRVASQGQCKTYTVALRLAQYDFLARATSAKPLLLLDDVFDRLDAERVERLVAAVGAERFGQIFITDTNRDHLDRILSRTPGDHRLWNVTEGAATAVSHVGTHHGASATRLLPPNTDKI